MTTGADNPAGLQMRHSLLVRIAHWTNALAFFGLLASGIGILLAFPELHWGETGYPGKPPWVRLGLSENFDHTAWGRNVHFLCAWILVLNGLVYVLSGVIGRHFRTRLLPTRTQMSRDHIVEDIRRHLRFQRHGTDGLHDYNLLQKIVYLVVILLLFPAMILSGLTMSPGVTTAFPELFAVFGGRQSARTIHFLTASLLVVFLVVHIWQVFLTGAVDQIRAMITGKAPAPEQGR